MTDPSPLGHPAPRPLSPWVWTSIVVFLAIWFYMLGARTLVPSPVVDATFLESLESPVSWAQAVERARECLERIALESN